MQEEFTVPAGASRLDVKAWQAEVARSCVPLSIAVMRGDGFEGVFADRALGDAALTQLRTGRHQAIHDPAHIRRSDSDYVLGSLQLLGTGILEQDGRRARLEAGGLVFYDATRPFAWTAVGAFGQLVVRVPRGDLRFRVSRSERWSAVPVAAASGVGRLFADSLRSLFREAPALAPVAAARLSESVLDLLALVLIGDVGAEAGPETELPALYLAKAMAFIDENLDDPDLDAAAVAGAVGISKRYLQHIFAAEGTTVGRHVLRARLHRCARDLVRRASAPGSITAIAFAHGFSSAAHFSCAFAKEFGMAPREYRARYLFDPSQVGVDVT